MSLEIALSVNGKPHKVTVTPTEMLVDVLRDRLGYTGTNKDCAQGICGCCTVLVDGRSVASCIFLAIQADGAVITTVEGLEGEGVLHPLQVAFLRHGGVQCGYCTPGFLMTAKELLDANPAPTRAEIADALRGNICRCTGYQKIVDAVEAAARSITGGGDLPRSSEGLPDG